MGGLRERVDRHARSRVHESRLGRSGEALDESRKDRDTEGPGALALGDAPLVVAIAIGQVEAGQEFAAKQLGGAEQGVGRSLRGLRQIAHEAARFEEVDARPRRLEGHSLAVRREARDLPRVDEGADLGEAPAQGGAWVVRPQPQQVAQALAQVRAGGHDEERQKRPRLLGRRQASGFPPRTSSSSPRTRTSSMLPIGRNAFIRSRQRPFKRGYRTLLYIQRGRDAGGPAREETRDQARGE